MEDVSSKKKILIVEDDVNLGFMLERYLNCEYYSTHREKSAGGGIKEASKNIYSLFLVDIGLPDASGFQVVEFIL